MMILDYNWIEPCLPIVCRAIVTIVDRCDAIRLPCRLWSLNTHGLCWTTYWVLCWSTMRPRRYPLLEHQVWKLAFHLIPNTRARDRHRVVWPDWCCTAIQSTRQPRQSQICSMFRAQCLFVIRILEKWINEKSWLSSQQFAAIAQLDTKSICWKRNGHLINWKFILRLNSKKFSTIKNFCLAAKEFLQLFLMNICEILLRWRSVPRKRPKS